MTPVGVLVDVVELDVEDEFLRGERCRGAAGLGRNDLEMENLVAVRQRREIVVDLEILAGSGEGDDAGRRVDGKEAARVAAGGERVRDMAAADIVVVGDDGRHGDRGRGAGLVLVEGDLCARYDGGSGRFGVGGHERVDGDVDLLLEGEAAHTAALVADLDKDRYDGLRSDVGKSAGADCDLAVIGVDGELVALVVGAVRVDELEDEGPVHRRQSRDR